MRSRLAFWIYGGLEAFQCLYGQFLIITRGHSGDEIRHAFIHCSKIFSYLPCPLMRKKRRKQNKPILEGLKMFYRMKITVSLAGCLHFLFLLINHDVKVHWESSFILFHVQRNDDDSDDINILPWLSIIG